ncbi:PREDICTED: beta-defensin 119 [Chrysochloris asiatica]|uniref:Beta-defensin n=1 Tax=Chrysochloris asiatica TaxID=185453 RepID=A0A9B0WMC0_CHRAS|nr:PREDICTED: beta-defensin 119 [Chrysochloris asiatica]
MKLLFLFLIIFLAMEPVVSERCWMEGHCRLVCKDDEDTVSRCPSRKRCCILNRYLTIEPVVIDIERTAWSTIWKPPKDLKGMKK